ncbi:MAG: hypothetical protein RIT81_19595 [Deltaproteobacteria bacterium]
MAGPRDEDAPPEVKKVRTPHGTRVARAIVCSACGAKDTVHFTPREVERALCRRCAAELLGVVDRDANIRPEKAMTCTDCGRVEMAFWRGDDPFLCRDCRQGIYSNQQTRTKKADRVAGGKVLRVRRRAPEEDED